MESFTLFYVLLALSGIIFLIRRHTANIYDVIIVHMTKKWYAAVLADLPPGARVLDVGVGTASALVANKGALVAKDLTFVGVDYDAAYIRKGLRVVDRAGLAARVALRCASIYDYRAPHTFDHAYFSGSLMLMPDAAAALRAVASMLAPGGKIYITQTCQKRATPFLATLKPLLKYATTIDFGQLTYERDLAALLDRVGFAVLRNEKIDGSVDTRWQAARIVVLQPGGGAARPGGVAQQ